QKSLASLRHAVNADPGPQIGDPVYALLNLTWADVTESFRLYGNVSDSELEKVTIQFSDLETDGSTSQEFRKEAEKYFRKEFATHSSDLEWDFEEWRFHI